MGVIEKYAELLPVTDKTPRITLGEGSTPLVHLDRISREMDIDLWGKLEGCNPSGSFKDRGMVMAVAKALGQEPRRWYAPRQATLLPPRQRTLLLLRSHATCFFRQGK